METFPLWLPTAFFFIALFYSMVGFGGGSSYLAVLALAGLPYRSIPTVSLFCNLIVTIGGCWNFYRGGHFEAKAVLPFVIFSIPMAYLGGRMTIGKEVFSILLGISLLVAALRMFLPEHSFERSKEISWATAWRIGLPTGGLLGFLAGLVGIGGGIFLSPFLLFLKWVNVKEASAAASFFIMVNSLSGLLGQAQKGTVQTYLLLPLGISVLLGGQIGSRLGAYRLSKVSLNRILGALILYASVKLIWIGL